MTIQQFPKFLLQGHRGSRGIMPENTIPSMLKAVADGANVLELDIQTSKDGQVIVAHDPYINNLYSLDPDGNEFTELKSRSYILYNMEYDQIKMFDVGSKYYAAYPKQEKMKTFIPTLGALIDAVEKYTSDHNLQKIIYNIEIKADAENDGKYHPEPKQLVSSVMDVLSSKNLQGRFYVQSFDVRQIQEVHRSYPEVIIGFLTEDPLPTVAENLQDIGFTPEIYSPHFKMATQEIIDHVQEAQMKFIPWTVNNTKDMLKLLAMGVDGIITDFPGELATIVK